MLALRCTPKQGPKSYLKFAPRFIGVSEDADAVQGIDDDDLVSPASVGAAGEIRSPSQFSRLSFRNFN